MSSLPLKVQVAIRDHWAREDSPLQNALRSLQDLLGHDVVVEPEWQLLVAELDALYADDRGALVAVVAGCLQTWAKSMTELLDDSAHDAWIETVLEKVPMRMRVFVEVADSEAASTAWSEQRDGFVVRLPKERIFQPAELFPVFRGDLLACFDEGKTKPQQPADAAGTADDWVGMEVDTESGRAEVVEHPIRSKAPARAKVEFLPSVASLPRPDQLFLRPPYHLTMIPGHQQIELQCSHSPSLQLLADYLKRWCRVNHSDTRNPPAVNVSLKQSAFGLGEMFDRLVLSTENNRYTDKFQVTSPMVVALIEGVLGYTLVTSNGGWNFRRDTEFRIL